MQWQWLRLSPVYLENPGLDPLFILANNWIRGTRYIMQTYQHDTAPHSATQTPSRELLAHCAYPRRNGQAELAWNEIIFVDVTLSANTMQVITHRQQIPNSN